MQTRWRRRWQVGLIASAVVIVACVPIQRVGLRDLRLLERDYIAAREPTACALMSLEPYAFGKIDLDEIDAVVEDLVRQALAESEQLKEQFEQRQVAPIPRVSTARDALAAALDAQVALYRAMLDDPTGSEDELRRLGKSNNEFERRAARARNLLLVGEPTGWNLRFVCDGEPSAVTPD